MGHSEVIMEYFRNPINNFKPEQYDIEHHEGNEVCGDDITIFLQLDEKKKTLEKFYYTGNPSIVTSAASSFFADLSAGVELEKILERDYKTIEEEGFEVTTRRKRAACIALLATQNAIYADRQQDKKVSFEDLIEDL